MSRDTGLGLWITRIGVALAVAALGGAVLVGGVGMMAGGVGLTEYVDPAKSVMTVLIGFAWVSFVVTLIGVALAWAEGDLG